MISMKLGWVDVLAAAVDAFLVLAAGAAVLVVVEDMMLVDILLECTLL